MDEVEPTHLWVIDNGDGTEWWRCSCGATGAEHDTEPSGSWAVTWQELKVHLIEAGQLTEEQAGSNPYAGYGGPRPPETNPLWAFRADRASDRRAARAEWGIGRRRDD